MIGYKKPLHRDACFVNGCLAFDNLNASERPNQRQVKLFSYSAVALVYYFYLYWNIFTYICFTGFGKLNIWRDYCENFVLLFTPMLSGVSGRQNDEM